METQERADRAETEAIARYLTLKAAWGACWGARPDAASRRRKDGRPRGGDAPAR